jgi:hypothetical protein
LLIITTIIGTVVPGVGDAIAGGRKVAKAAGKVGDLIKNGQNLDEGAKILNKVNDGIQQVSQSKTKVDINIAQNKLASCFLAGTLVSKYSTDNIEQKELVPIEEIKYGDQVWSYNRTKNSWESRTVLDTYCREYTGDIVTLNIGGKIIDTTGGHPFWVLEGDDLENRPLCDCLPDSDQKITPDGRWVYARDLHIDDVVRSRSLGTQKISELELSITETLVYNFLVDDLHNYAVGKYEILVHNTNSPGKTEKMKPGKGSWDEGIGKWNIVKDGKYKDDIGKARELLDTSPEFNDFLHKLKNKHVSRGGNKHNPDIDDDGLVEIFREWLDMQ